MTTRSALRAAVSDALANRHLIWSGIRGDDVESLSDLPQLSGSFTITNAYRTRPLQGSLAYEESTGVRVDLETWDIDEHLADEATVEFRRHLLRAMSSDCALLPYRPSKFLSAATFARADRCLNLGLFGSHQFAFEHKPWVESELARLGVATLDWHYLADEEQLDARRWLEDGPVVIRRSRTSGGEGMFLVEREADIDQLWPSNDEAFASVSRYVAGATPLNVGGTVWDDGVTVHYPSVQLIGIPSCVTRPFGYCGNDFAATKSLPPATLDEIEATTARVGGWLSAHGYRGTFGVDYLLDEGRLLFTEVNPRFQGSTRASAELSVATSQACLLLEHLAAMLHLPAPELAPLRDRVAEAPDLAQVIVHWAGATPAAPDSSALFDLIASVVPSVRMDVALPADVAASPGAALGRFVMRRSVTADGYRLDGDLDRAIKAFYDRPGATMIPDATMGRDDA